MQPSLAEPRYALLNPGDQPIPGFRLVRRRGRGGFGEVWEAEASGGFFVALKFIRLSSRARAAELRSLEFVRGIHHPNLLANFGSWQVDDTLIIGMELADRSLWDRYVEAADQGLRGIPRTELLGYLSEVAAGLVHLNQYRHNFDGRTGIGVQHRDLKPSNILLFGGGAKVADLGMARAMEGEVTGHTGIWTFAYAAPEFFRGETNRHSDQYSLAATYCQLRGGRLPFEGSAASVTAGHLFGRPDLETLPEPERAVLERALAKNPGDRWPDCRAFVEALRAVPASEVPEVLIEPDGPVDIDREYRSSTGAIGDLVGGLAALGLREPASSWPDFDSTDSRDSVLLALANAPDPAPPARFSADDVPVSPDLVPTRIFPAISPEPEPEAKSELVPGPATLPDFRPAASWPADEFEAAMPPPGSARRWARFGRHSGTAILTAIALVLAGVHTPTHHDHAPADPDRTPREPRLIVAGGFGSAAAEPDPDPSFSTDPTPAVAPARPAPPPLVASAPPVIPAPTPAPAEPTPSPAPARETDEVAVRHAPAGSSPSPDRPAPSAGSDPVLEAPIDPGLSTKPRSPLSEQALGSESPGPQSPTAPDPVPADVPSSRSPKVEDPPAPAAPEKPAVTTPAPSDKPAVTTPAPSDKPAVTTPAPSDKPAVTTPAPSDKPAVTTPAPSDKPAVTTPAPSEKPAVPGPRVLAFNDSSATSSPFKEPTPARPPVAPNLATAAFTRGMDLLSRGLHRQAIPEFDEAIRLDPNRPVSYQSRAVALHLSGSPRGALADYDQAIRLQIQLGHAVEPMFYVTRGEAYHALGRLPEALADFDEALRLQPNDADARYRRGKARYDNGNFAGSIADLDEAIRLDPPNARAVKLRDAALVRLPIKSDRASVTAAAPNRPPTTLNPLSTSTPYGAGVIPGRNPADPAFRPTIYESSQVAAPNPYPNPNSYTNPGQGQGQGQGQAQGSPRYDRPAQQPDPRYDPRYAPQGRHPQQPTRGLFPRLLQRSR